MLMTKFAKSSKYLLLSALLLIGLSLLFPSTTQSALYTPPQALFVALDDRPSTFLFPQQIARIGGGQLLIPERALLGKAYRPGNCEAIIDWLEQNAATAPQTIISADMLAYGGLIASRTAAVSKSQALKHLQVLEQLKAAGCHNKVFVILPRLSLRTSDAEAPYEQALLNWARSGKTTPPQSVPSKIFQEYCQVRNRNAAVIAQLVEMTDKGSIDELVIGQDDAAVTGPHLAEQAAIRAQIAKLGVQRQVTIISGADELAMNIVCGWLAKAAAYTPHIEIDYASPQDGRIIPALESCCLDKTIDEHLNLSGAARSQGTGTVLLIEAPSKKPYAPPTTVTTADQNRVKGMAERISQLRSPLAGQSRLYGIADLHLVNRADPLLAQTILDNFPLWELEAYAAWNTSSNTLGTAIAQASAHQIARVKGGKWGPYALLESEKTHQAFNFARLADDYAYQAVIRTTLQKEVQGLPRDPDPLLNVYGPAGMQARAQAIEWGEKIWTEKLAGRTYFYPTLNRDLTFKSMTMHCVLPWPRVFELEVRADIRLEPVEIPRQPQAATGKAPKPLKK